MTNIRKLLDKIFGELKITWPVVVVMALLFGVYTALMALLVPDGNSFHDIAVTMEAWILPAILIIVNSKKPLDAALKTFVFFLISQPLVYLIQVPFNPMGWDLFNYYGYWFIITLLTFPGAFLGWYVKKNRFYSGIILSVLTVLLAVTGIDYIRGLAASFPNHLLSIIYCFAMIPLLVFGILKNKWPRILAIIITTIASIIYIVASGNTPQFETYSNTFLESNGIVLVGEPRVENWHGTGTGGVELINSEMQSFKLSGENDGHYYFTIVDDAGSYDFEYYFDSARQTVVVEKQ